jgi:hypothetical protein
MATVMTSADNETEYAFWTDEDNSFRINYSLPLFHEIDFQVNEGYRRIPHGGIEIGGILYGTSDKNTAFIEAFIPIECEHATGPSFHLSERDLAKLTASLAEATSKEELKSLSPLGWFIAHTRSPLRMSERELQLFNQFFPGPGKITLLIKPERFQPTRFGFIVRKAGGAFKTDVSNSAVILPLPGRAGGSGKGSVASIPAPTVKAAPPEKKPEEISPKVAAPPAAPPPSENKEKTPPEAVNKPESVIVPPPILPSVDEIRKRRSEHSRSMLGIEENVSPDVATRQLDRFRNPSRARLFFVLVLAAMLGCGVGYWAYLQLPPAEIDLRIQKHGSNLLIQWPPEQTRSAQYAAIRIDNGGAMPLTDDQKASGQVDIKQTSGNMKIELIAQRWIRNSRGIMRFISLPMLSQQSAAPASRESVER